MEKYEVDMQRDKVRAQSLGLKVLLWLIAISVAGIIVTVILAVLRVAVQAMVIVAGTLVVIGLIGVVAYNALKYKWQAHEYRRQLERSERQSIQNNKGGE